MILTIDIGNSNIDLAYFNGNKIVSHYEFETKKFSTSYEYALIIEWTLKREKLQEKDILGVALSSVVPSLTSAFIDAIKYLFGKPPFVVEPGIKTGISIETENPKEVGADLICNVVAITEEYGHCGIAVDFGTATTFSVVEKKKFLGAAIAPGVGTSAFALFEKTAKLPQVDIKAPESSLGKNTISAIQAGIVYGFAGLVDGILERQIKELKYKPVLVSTGGWAKRIVPYTKYLKEKDIDPYLTLKGLYYLYLKNL
ncbi:MULTISPECIES: type III pantothenate kinase [Dictyoglomus]|uniref:Type III pantothenate kinase n=1 Tax=Dictyoglomus turgidum (strain DSM 6724 / Z-1310) TaxID=515635 RepID=COAX_DICTD|nr:MULTISPECIES: type III pantothenate kinase [Dictyoglomus]B8E2Z9.1 RecName: Full=Type III pantothenate kinase; AltName: Full=PanK-III; AltName: Full=Pantothenic acid kinase [Dictyoglomus turgidum DSM 6724]ACK42499.1 putative transcriptional acitvator, Baf family [Dictyoglomus turgidum DSM 6724]PNV79184.1 MAG: type III pantothenate kinase [Dictyoglomus turgidum]HBU32044.1 type III pantothenate kinase [Dictyoglomus sp.]